VDATGRTVLVANYSTGSVAALPIQEDGSLGAAASFVQHVGSSVHPQRQKGPYAHCLLVGPDNRFAYAADLGIDQVLVYRLDPAKALLTPAPQAFVRTPPGTGPRHLTFHPDGRHLYVVNELANSVTRFDVLGPDAFLAERETISTLPDDYKETTHCADVKVTPDGRFLYATNRGHDSLAVFRLGEDGRLSRTAIVPSGGQGPQNLLIAPGGDLLVCANMRGSNVVVFRLDPQTGTPQPLGAPLELPSPSCLRLMK
jgi:6-phosphogluconolactonase